jgi:hypothetical protein
VVRPAAAVVTVGPCYSGEYFDGLVCQPCETGTYLVDDTNANGTSPAQICVACPAGTYSDVVGGANATGCTSW